jgi:hypothetical protein
MPANCTIVWICEEKAKWATNAMYNLFATLSTHTCNWVPPPHEHDPSTLIDWTGHKRINPSWFWWCQSTLASTVDYWGMLACSWPCWPSRELHMVYLLCVQNIKDELLHGGILEPHPALLWWPITKETCTKPYIILVGYRALSS